jgi:hypothetical protein
MYVVEKIRGSFPQPIDGSGPFETFQAARAFAEECLKQPGIVVGLDAVRIRKDSEEIETLIAGVQEAPEYPAVSAD